MPLVVLTVWGDLLRNYGFLFQGNESRKRGPRSYVAARLLPVWLIGDVKIAVHGYSSNFSVISLARTLWPVFTCLSRCRSFCPVFFRKKRRKMAKFNAKIFRKRIRTNASMYPP